MPGLKNPLRYWKSKAASASKPCARIRSIFLVAGEPLLKAPAAYPEPLRSILEPYLARRPERSVIRAGGGSGSLEDDAERDPSQGLAVGLSHVAAADARDPEMATPNTGSHRGSEASTMETSIRVVGGG